MSEWAIWRRRTALQASAPTAIVGLLALMPTGLMSPRSKIDFSEYPFEAYTAVGGFVLILVSALLAGYSRKPIKQRSEA